MDSITASVDSVPLVLPGAWQGWGAAQAGAVLRLDPAAGEVVLEAEGRELRLLMAGGGASALIHAALALHAAIPADIWPGGAPGVVKAPAVLLSGRDQPGVAAARTAENGVQHFLANLPAALAGQVEGVHQLRIAIRRLRTALVLFAPSLPGAAEADELDAVLHALGRTLGGARDWDVFCLDILPNLPGAAELAPLEAVAAERRDAARAQVARDLTDESIVSLVRAAASWVGSAAQSAEGERLEDVAPALLARLERKVRRRGRHIAELSVEQMHALRRANKKLRYAVEYLRPLFPKRVKPFLRACEQLGQSLGEVNDAAHAASVVAGLAAERPDLQAAAETAAAALVQRQDAAVARAREDWRAWKSAEPFWT